MVDGFFEKRMAYSRVAILLTLSLCGCATAAQRQFQAMKTTNQEIAAQLKACGTTVYNSQEMAPLRTHLPLTTSEATLEQMSDRSLATPSEIAAIYTVHPRLQACRKTMLDALSQNEPTLVPVLVASFNKNEDDLLAVTQRKMSWGDYVHRLRDRSVEAQTQIQAADQRVVAGLKQEHEAEVAQRQRAAEALAAWAQTQQLINAANRPVLTNCTGFGNNINCITH